MKHRFTSSTMSRVFRGFVLALAFVLVACGGDADEPTPSPPADTGQAAVPTAPPLESTPAAEVSEEEITVLQPQQPATAQATVPEAESVAASPDSADNDVSTPQDAEVVDLTESEPAASPPDALDLDESEAVDVASTPSGMTVATPEAVPTDSSTPESAVNEDASSDDEEADTEADTEPTERPRTGEETFDHPGDGTGGSGMPGESSVNEPVEDDTGDLLATPAASPVAQLSISGCDVPDVPGFLGETSTFIVTTDINFRTGPGVECEPVMDEPIGEGQIVDVLGGPVTQLEDGSEWVQIEIDGEPGWITTEFIEPTE